VAVVKLSNAAGADQCTKPLETTRTFWDGHGQDGLAALSQFGALGHEPQSVEIHVGPAGDGNQGLSLGAPPLDPSLGTGDGKGTRGLQDRAGILEYIFDRRADIVVIDQDHVIYKVLAQPE